METELQLLRKNQLWELSELPPGRKAIGRRWVFQRKHDADANVERYKARLAAQGYNQKYGIGYNEKFCPVVRFESVRTLIALAAKHKLQLHQLYVATALLNVELMEEIYMKQPEQFEMKRSLKQSSRCWNETLDKHLKKMGFKQSKDVPCIYILNPGGEIFIIASFCRQHHPG